VAVVTVSASGGQGKTGREMRKFTVPGRNCQSRTDARKADPSWSCGSPLAPSAAAIAFVTLREPGRREQASQVIWSFLTKTPLR